MNAATSAGAFSVVHRLSALLCPPIGLLFNFLLIFLVLKKTPKEMRLHSRILLQTGILDILLLLLTTFGQLVVSYEQNTLIVFYEGYFIDVFPNDNSLRIFAYIWFLFNSLDSYGLTVQFIYRYLILNRNVKITLCQYLQMFSLPFSIVCIFNGISYFHQILNGNINGDEELISSISKNGSTKVVAIILDDNLILKISNGLYMLFSLTCFGIIAFCGWKMTRHVTSNLVGNKELSKQLTRTLIFLAILPFVFFATANFVIIANMSTNQKQGIVNDQQNVEGGLRMVQISLSLLNHLLPVLNPMVTILTNRPYRSALARAIACNKIGPTSHTSNNY